MTSGNVCCRARAEHDSIRKRLARLEVLAARAEAGEGGGAGGALWEIDDDLEALSSEIRNHLDWEEAEVPGTLGTDTRGSERAVWLRSSHDELRIVLEFCRHSCGDENHPVLLAQRVRDLADLLRGSLEVEEELTIEFDASRQGVAAIDQPSG